ncbi:unnamed protein product [Peronospora belbahrii]|uniref:Uncharacterized protein n=1 Tax=Peronospora belbahrii TaxID=622444 RepID=A0AAU9L3S6_9STRA|nr:unnamed protein product [Peronospora belbahrii]
MDGKRSYVLEESENGLAGDNVRLVKTTPPKDNKRKRVSGDGDSGHVAEEPEISISSKVVRAFESMLKRRMVDSSDGKSAHALESKNGPIGRLSRAVYSKFKNGILIIAMGRVLMFLKIPRVDMPVVR